MTASSLPTVLAEIAAVAGQEAAWALARAHGGVTVYIPHRAKNGHWLTELVGFDAADKICQHYRVGDSGIRLLIPLAKQAAARERLVKALEAGMSAPEAASTAGMHERTAYRARKKIAGEDDRQGKLF